MEPSSSSRRNRYHPTSTAKPPTHSSGSVKTSPLTSFPPILAHPAVTLVPPGSAVWIDAPTSAETYTKLRIHLLSHKLDHLIDSELDRRLAHRASKQAKAQLFWDKVDLGDCSATFTTTESCADQPVYSLLHPPPPLKSDFDRLRDLEQRLVMHMVNQSRSQDLDPPALHNSSGPIDGTDLSAVYVGYTVATPLSNPNMQPHTGGNHYTQSPP